MNKTILTLSSLLLFVSIMSMPFSLAHSFASLSSPTVSAKSICKGDMDRDGWITHTDLRLFLVIYGMEYEEFSDYFWHIFGRFADFNDDKVINQVDLGSMLSVLGTRC